MRRRRAAPARLWWTIYTIGGLVTLLALVLITRQAVGLERSEARARAQALRNEDLRLALWRLDSWMAPHLATEAARPYFAYRSFYPESRPWASLYQRIEPGEKLAPSPLLDFDSDQIQLHFQVGPEGGFSSPQVPPADQRALAQELIGDARIDEHASTLQDLANALSLAHLRAQLDHIRQAEADPIAWGLAEEQLAEVEKKEASNGSDQEEDELGLQTRSWRELAKRQAIYQENVELAERSLPPREKASRGRNYPASRPALDQSAAELSADAGESYLGAGAELRVRISAPAAESQPAAPLELSTSTFDGPAVGPFLPLWLPDLGTTLEPDRLLFVRNVQVAGEQYFQGFVCDWPRLRAALADQVVDLLPQVAITPTTTGRGLDPGTALATLPAALDTPPVFAAALPLLTPTRLTLLIAWLVVPASIVAIAITLRATIAFGHKRSHFASAVTHELRTPLTTFQLYTEMLAEGMVRDPEQQRSYLGTLKEESARLARLVENVLAYARLEEGRRVPQPQELQVSELLDRALPPLERRAAEAGFVLRAHALEGADLLLHVDVDAVEQILGNLVDNACKYAAIDQGIDLYAATEEGRLRLAVEDQGQGIDRAQRRAIFRPFERGGQSVEDKPGLGLGLALSRGLARDLGGDLLLEDTQGSGARFVLVLPGKM